MWAAFQEDMNQWHRLEWTYTTPAQSCFMDLTITIENGMLTTLLEKERNLHLYLPPTSSHPKGCSPGLVFGHVLWACRLCSCQADAYVKIEELLEREHTCEFDCAEENAATVLQGV